MSDVLAFGTAVSDGGGEFGEVGPRLGREADEASHLPVERSQLSAERIGLRGHDRTSVWQVGEGCRHGEGGEPLVGQWQQRRLPDGQDVRVVRKGIRRQGSLFPQLTALDVAFRGARAAGWCRSGASGARRRRIRSVRAAARSGRSSRA